MYLVTPTAASWEDDGDQPMANITDLFDLSALVVSSRNGGISILLARTGIPPRSVHYFAFLFRRADGAPTGNIGHLTPEPTSARHPPTNRSITVHPATFSMSRGTLSYLLTSTSVPVWVARTDHQWARGARCIGPSIDFSTAVPSTTLRTVVI